MDREPLLPNHRLLAKAFRRAPAARALSTSTRNGKWEGRQPEEHVTNEGDRHNNSQHDASREGKRDRAGGDAGTASGSRGATEKSGNSNEKARDEFPEAPEYVCCFRFNYLDFFSSSGASASRDPFQVVSAVLTHW